MRTRDLAWLLLLFATPVLANDPDLPDGTDKANATVKAFKVPAGIKVDVFAAEPKLASPVAISIDDKGRIFVAEEFRLGRGAVENRDNAAFKFSFFLDDDLQTNTLNDRLKNYQKWQHKIPGGFDWFTKYSDQVRMVEDTKGTGKADRSTIFATGFNQPLDGLAAGVLAHGNDVFFTCIPHLWRLRDTNGDGIADEKTPLLSGFGTNIAFFGHDLHGLIIGPDGKLYFSVGDRGFDVTALDGTRHSGPRTGAVFRCNLDGTDFEVVHRGLRNPQEIAFDEHGNFFVDDNNCDKGDHARLVYIVEGGDSGWNMAYQSIPAPYMTGPWFAERLWHLPHPGQPAYIVPPAGKIGTGPSGFCFTSGTSLAERYKNAFFMCNYTGNGGIESFKVKSRGAGFEITDYHDFLKPVMATDVDFGPDGKMYISDFVNLDWSGKSLGGRIYAAYDATRIQQSTVAEAKKLFAEGFAKLRKDGVTKENSEEWQRLLAHPDMKVRLRTQHLLAELAQGKDEKNKAGARSVLQTTVTESRDHFAKIHAVWGLGQIGKSDEKAMAPVIALLGTSIDEELQAQAAKVLGDTGTKSAEAKLIAGLKNPNARIQFFSAQSLGKLKSRDAVGPLFQVLAANRDADPWLRSACVTALARIGDAEAVAAQATDSNASVRLGVVLAQRQWRDRRVVRFLTDSDPLVRAEAARAVHDLPLEADYPALAAILPNLTAGSDDESTVRRAIDANFRLGKAANAQAVFDVVVSSNHTAAVRAEALSALGDWTNPQPRDRVTGFWRPLEKRDPATIRNVVEPRLSELLTRTTGRLQTDAVLLVAKLGVKTNEGQFAEWVREEKRSPESRAAALRLLQARNSTHLPTALDAALTADSPTLRAEAREILAVSTPAKGVPALAKILADPKATLAERQRALATLPLVKDKAAAALLDDWAKQLAADKVPVELRVDVHEAIKAAPTPTREPIRLQYEGSLPRDPVGKFRDALIGGNSDRGKEIFFAHSAAQCVRCHTIRGQGGTAGPELTEVAKRYPEKTREFFLESLMLPSAKIAPGFASISVTLVDGRLIAGTLLAETKKELTIHTPEGKKMVVPVDDVEKRSTPLSAMPAVDKTLSAREVRDLIEYLTTLK